VSFQFLFILGNHLLLLLNRSKYIDEEQITAAALDSMEKYRPCNYDIGPARGDGDDINDIRDYYSGLATRQKAIRRVYDFSKPDQVRVLFPVLPNPVSMVSNECAYMRRVHDFNKHRAGVRSSHLDFKACYRKGMSSH
jgi:hypothetical protein